MKKNVLIISKNFAPSNIISAIRPTKLAKYLTRSGYEVTVLTVEQNLPKDVLLEKDLAECGRVLRAPQSESFPFLTRLLRRPLRKKKAPAKNGAPAVSSEAAPPSASKQNALRRLLSQLAQYLRFRKQEQEFYKSALHYVQQSALDLSHFDVMISTCFPMSAHMVALALKAKCPTMKWIADYRDPIDPNHSVVMRRYFERRHKRVLAHCDTLTAASDGYLKMLARTSGVRGVRIYNGFDPEDGAMLQPAPAENSEKKVFTIVGMGGLYAGRRDVSVIFAAVSDLLKSGRIRRDQIRIDYYGSGASGAYLRQKLEELELPPLYTDHGRVSRDEVLHAQSAAQMLLSGGWDTSDYHGVLPGKFSEQLLLRKPIIGIVCGTGKNCEFARLIRTLRVGYCYEEGDGKESYEGLKKYIAESFTYWRTREKELYEPDEKKRQTFDYNHLIREWIEVIEDR